MHLCVGFAPPHRQAPADNHRRLGSLSKCLCATQPSRTASDAADQPRRTHLHEAFTSHRPSNASRQAPPVQLATIDHLALPAHDLDTLIDFYTSVLGFVGMHERPAFPFDGAWLQGPGVVLHLIEIDLTAPEAARQVCDGASMLGHNSLAAAASRPGALAHAAVKALWCVSRWRAA